MKETPIIFNTEMVQAILNGTKTMTRRIVKGVALKWLDESGFTLEFVGKDDNAMCPYGVTGDRLWVRETWMPLVHSDRSGEYGYKADLKDNADKLKWKPSIHMPKIASRITLEITGIRIERLQDITKEDCLKEGIGRHIPVPGDGDPVYKNYQDKGEPLGDPRASFFSLWESINGSGSWFDDPWVWVISFKVVKPITE